LELLQRPELDLTLTKLHVFALEYDQVVFLDADTLVLADIEGLFGYVDEALFAACPDIGWPDCFNSGVFACRPSGSLFRSLSEFAHSNTSFDGTCHLFTIRR
jgi:glycogenin glucosyltransferase